MGLQATISAGVTTAFSALDDLVEKATLQAASTFDDVLETETVGATGTIDVLQDNQKESALFLALAGDSESADIMLLADAASATITPVQGMEITWRGDLYNLHSIDDEQNSLLMLGLRRPI